jgi:hypothetical protein
MLLLPLPRLGLRRRKAALCRWLARRRQGKSCELFAVGSANAGAVARLAAAAAATAAALTRSDIQRTATHTTGMQAQKKPSWISARLCSMLDKCKAAGT